MGIVDTAEAARIEGENLLSSANQAIRSNSYHTMQLVAVHISDFLQNNGQLLDDRGYSGLVNQLGAAVDALVKGEVNTYDTQEYKSPFKAFTNSLNDSIKKFSFDTGMILLGLILLIIIVKFI